MKLISSNKLLRFLPAIFWMAVIFYFSSRSTIGIGDTQTSRFLILKSFHLIEYATLGIFLFFAYKNFKHTISTAYLYAISDEIHQYFIPGRMGKFTDTLIDLTGILIGLLVLRLLLNHKFFKYLFTQSPK